MIEVVAVGLVAMIKSIVLVLAAGVARSSLNHGKDSGIAIL